MDLESEVRKLKRKNEALEERLEKLEKKFELYVEDSQLALRAATRYWCATNIDKDKNR